MIELEGNYFSPQYEIWLDDVPIETTFIDEKRIQGVIPSVATFMKENEPWPSSYPIQVHINLVQPETGFCVASGLIFTYSPVLLESKRSENSDLALQFGRVPIEED